MTTAILRNRTDYPVMELYRAMVDGIAAAGDPTTAGGINIVVLVVNGIGAPRSLLYAPPVKNALRKRPGEAAIVWSTIDALVWIALEPKLPLKEMRRQLHEAVRERLEELVGVWRGVRGKEVRNGQT